MGAKLVLAADLMALTILKSPGEIGADVAVGSTQRFGIPLGFGGPHAAYFAVKQEYIRKMPGRMVGVSKDREGKQAYRLTLQTREQHIRRDKATSNICTSQVLLANMAGMYAVYHGPEGLREIAEGIARKASRLGRAFAQAGIRLEHQKFFDTLLVEFASMKDRDLVIKKALDKKINLRLEGERKLALSLDETVTESDLETLAQIFGVKLSEGGSDFFFSEADRRSDPCLKHSIFKTIRSETQLMRYIKRLERADLSLTDSMIPLGSCTMKLNSAAELAPVSWPAFSRLHPFVPGEQARGYHAMIEDLETWLCDLTGFSGFSMQPNSGPRASTQVFLLYESISRTVGKSIGVFASYQVQPMGLTRRVRLWPG